MNMKLTRAIPTPEEIKKMYPSIQKKLDIDLDVRIGEGVEMFPTWNKGCHC